MRRFNLVGWGKAAGVIAVIAALVLPATTLISAQGSDPQTSDTGQCPAIVAQALELTTASCTGAGRNQACYGHTNLDAQPQPEVDEFQFSVAGDIEDIVNLRSLRLGAMDEELGTWGIALLRLQASIPDSSPENVTVVLFGDTSITDDTPETMKVPIYSIARQNINVRVRPNSDAYTLATLGRNQDLIATGQLADGSWLRVLLDTGESGWLFASLVGSDEDLGQLAIVEESDSYLGPMQAFTLQSGVDDAPCAEAPNSGLIIQTPEGYGSVTFLVNEVDIQLSSTVFFQAETGNRLDVAVIDGTASVTAGGFTQEVNAGQVVSIPLSESGAASGMPSAPRAYNFSLVGALPVNLLPRLVSISEPVEPVIYVEPTTEPTSEPGATPIPSSGSGPAPAPQPTDETTSGTSPQPTPAPAPTAVCKPRPPGNPNPPKGTKWCD